METEITKMRVSRYRKNLNGKKWYKDILNYLDYRTPFNQTGYAQTDYDRIRTKKINYNLFNGIIDKSDFEYVYKPIGEDVGNLPADFTNKDIISGKIKVLLGMEMERSFPWRVIAVNEDATTRREQEKFGRIREYVVQQIMLPIRQQLMLKYAQDATGEVTQDQQQQIMKQVETEMQAMTPEEVNIYMKRKHQDPAEKLSKQIMDFVVKEQKVKTKFNKGWKHATISSEEVYWMGIINGKPVLHVINPLHFEYDKSSEEEFFENGEWAGVELWMSPSQVVEFFGDELTDTQIDDLYKGYASNPEQMEFRFDGSTQQYGKVRVLHRAWRALRKVGFLSYLDEQGMPQVRLVDEKYKLNPGMGDIEIEWKWIPEVYEGYKINRDVYVRLRPVPGQIKNIENLYEAPLPYYGGIYDNLNSIPTSLIDRMKTYQYYYNIIMYRIEMLMASDNGKWILMNINMIPNSKNINMEKWLYYTKALKIGWMNPNEEGNKNNQSSDISQAAKEIDMSLVSDIQKYIDLAEYIEQRCGATIGVTKEMEGRIGQYQAVKTTEQAISQGNYIVEPYFEFHNIIKHNVMEGLVNLSALAFATNDTEKLNYILDDFSREILRIDKPLLGMSHFGLFVGNSMDTIKTKEAINNLGLTAMQNQTVDLSDVIKVLKSDDITGAEEKLAVAEERKREEALRQNREQNEHELEMENLRERAKEKDHEREKELIILKEGERRETELQKQAILAMGFAEDKDVNKNQIPDVLEVARKGVETNLKIRKQDLDEDKFEHTKEVDKQKLSIEKKKANAPVKQA